MKNSTWFILILLVVSSLGLQAQSSLMWNDSPYRIVSASQGSLNVQGMTGLKGGGFAIGYSCSGPFVINGTDTINEDCLVFYSDSNEITRIVEFDSLQDLSNSLRSVFSPGNGMIYVTLENLFGSHSFDGVNTLVFPPSGIYGGTVILAYDSSGTFKGFYDFTGYRSLIWNSTSNTDDVTLIASDTLYTNACYRELNRNLTSITASTPDFPVSTVAGAFWLPVNGVVTGDGHRYLLVYADGTIDVDPTSSVFLSSQIPGTGQFVLLYCDSDFHVLSGVKFPEGVIDAQIAGYADGKFLISGSYNGIVNIPSQNGVIVLNNLNPYSPVEGAFLCRMDSLLVADWVNYYLPANTFNKVRGISVILPVTV